MYSTPIVYIFFNRPKQTQKTFARIREIQPQTLYLIADGPRAGREDDARNCAECRRIVEGMIDWKCNVIRDFAPENLGCGRRLSSGLTSAFAQLGEAIVLEDDIFPHPDFFTYCATMLARYRDDSRIHAINGFNPLGRYAPANGAATPSVFNSIWGWASWQRSWKDYRFDLNEWANIDLQKQIRAYVGSDLIYQHYGHSFDKMLREHVDTWDFQWSFTLLKTQRLALVSSVNLIENIGFAADATHTVVPEPFFRDLRVYPTVNTRKERPTDSPDRLHDKLYSEVILAASEKRIALMRFIARHPLMLALARRKLD